MINKFKVIETFEAMFTGNGDQQFIDAGHLVRAAAAKAAAAAAAAAEAAMGGQR